ncbi:hypothetical protein ACHAXT_013090 [Thalassiosira profunda]
MNVHIENHAIYTDAAALDHAFGELEYERAGGGAPAERVSGGSATNPMLRPNPDGLKLAPDIAAHDTFLKPTFKAETGGSISVEEIVASKTLPARLGGRWKPRNCAYLWPKLKDTLLEEDEEALFGFGPRKSNKSSSLLCRMKDCENFCENYVGIPNGDSKMDHMCRKHYYTHLADPELRAKYTQKYLGHPSKYGDRYKETTLTAVPEELKGEFYQKGDPLKYVPSGDKRMIKCRNKECPHMGNSARMDHMCQFHYRRNTVAAQRHVAEKRAAQAAKVERREFEDMSLHEKVSTQTYDTSPEDIERNPNWQTDLDGDVHMSQNAWIHHWLKGDVLEKLFRDKHGDIVIMPLADLLKKSTMSELMSMHPHLARSRVDKNWKDQYAWGTTDWFGGYLFMQGHHEHEMKEGDVLLCMHVTPNNKQHNGVNGYEDFHQFKPVGKGPRGDGDKMNKNHVCMVRAKAQVRPCLITKYVLKKGCKISEADMTVVRVNGDMQNAVSIDAKAKGAGAIRITELGAIWEAYSGLVKLFTPLLPKAVRERIRFESGPLSEVEDLREVAEGGAMRIQFVEEVAALAYGD